MITENLRDFVEDVNYAFVATADAAGTPHLAVGKGLHIPDPGHLVFDAWFCRRTLENLGRNPRVAVAVVAVPSGTGYQFIGTVAEIAEAGILDGFAPEAEPSGMPQVCWCLKVRVEEVLEFSHGIHSDTPLSLDEYPTGTGER